MTLIFIALLIAVLSLEALLSAYFGQNREKPKWMRWLDGGIILLLVVFAVLVVEQGLSLLHI